MFPPLIGWALMTILVPSVIHAEDYPHINSTSNNSSNVALPGQTIQREINQNPVEMIITIIVVGGTGILLLAATVYFMCLLCLSKYRFYINKNSNK